MSTITYGTIREAKADAVAPFNPYADGYGPKIPTRYWVRLDTDTPTARWRRVWVAQYGNAGSAYVVVKGADVYLDDHDLLAALKVAVRV